MAKTKEVPARSRAKVADTWDLARLFASDDAWERAFRRWEKQIAGYEAFRGHLADSPSRLARCLAFDSDFDRAGERLGTYAMLKASEDLADSRYQRMVGRYQHVAGEAAEAASYIRPEIMAVAAASMQRFLKSRQLAPFRLQLERMLRYKPHTLGRKEEKLLAMQTEMAQAANRIFDQLHDADLRFGLVRNEKGEKVELGNASFTTLLNSPKRSVRRAAFQQYYAAYQAHENTLAATLSASVQRDVYYARARGYAGARAAALFPDRIPFAVYDNLIHAVQEHLPTLHRYYELRRRKMRLRSIHHYDTYVPILPELQKRHSWAQAVRIILSALEPLGADYRQTLEKGLLGRWCDRYPNRGKRSGAFSCGSYDGDPHILMNYDANGLEHVFTLAHEAGHSMHSYYCARSQPFLYYQYTIFVAEVASTLNEQLLSHYLLDRAKTRPERAFLVNRQIDAIRATIIRQTMFAEFEKATHELAESGEPLTVECFKRVYGDLLKGYFGPRFELDPCLDLECFRIPHFYRAFYVYKYATGLAAAIALARRILTGGRRERDDYLNFLKAGGSKYPLDLLRDAGVDMESRQPVAAALEHFESLVDELEELS